VQDGEITLAESGAVIEYLVDVYGGGKLRPERGTPAAIRYTYWLHFAEGSAMPLLLLKLYLTHLGTAASAALKRVDLQIAEQLSFIENTLVRSVSFAGESFTASDIQMSFPLEGLLACGNLDDRYPQSQDFIGRMRARTAYKAAMTRDAAAFASHYSNAKAELSGG
jgi:glutathione S-transferase